MKFNAVLETKEGSSSLGSIGTYKIVEQTTLLVRYCHICYPMSYNLNTESVINLLALHIHIFRIDFLPDYSL